MRPLGIIGGLSWYSTAMYYRHINSYVERTMGLRYSAELMIYSLNFKDIYDLQKAGQWGEVERIISDAALKLQKQGAEAVMLASNTVHLVAEEVQKQLAIPLLHIASAVVNEAENANIKRVGIAGTSYTLKNNLYGPFLKDKNIDFVKPDEQQMQQLDDLIFNHLVRDNKSDAHHLLLKQIINSLIDNGAEAIVAGCTEIHHALVHERLFVPVFDSALLHAQMGARFVMGQNLGS